MAEVIHRIAGPKKPAASGAEEAGSLSSLDVPWADVDSRDLLPLAWFKNDEPLKGVTHDMVSPKRGKKHGVAKCDVRKNGMVAVVDYRGYKNFNEKHGALSGLTRLTFLDPSRTQLKSVEWSDTDESAFMPASLAHQATAPALSSLRFRAAFQRFQAIHRAESGKELTTFSASTTLAYKRESYKSSIPERARERLGLKEWSFRKIGSGQILDSVIAAIEMPGNNLLQWEARQGPQSRVHLRLLEARKKPAACRELESAFFDLFRQKRTDEAVFERLVELCGRRYELLAYLFFIAGPDRFLPVRTKSFDRAFVELGSALRTTAKCAWGNYQAYCGLIAEIQKKLIDEGIADATLLDAHSFCWILARHKASAKSDSSSSVPVPSSFDGHIEFAIKNKDFVAKEDAAIRDMQALAVKRAASGRVAEEIALASERERLIRGGRPDLADRVEDVSKKPGMGYDLRSYEFDGSARFIEVKNVSGGARFFLSANEWLTSRAREKNYWFYLVDENASDAPIISYFQAAKLKQEHLEPTQYIVRF